MNSEKDDNLKKRDSDFVNAEKALQRAALKAREIASKTGTAVVYMKNGKMIEERPGPVGK